MKFALIILICCAQANYLCPSDQNGNKTPLETTQIELGGHSLIVEVADTAESLTQGLMGRKHLADGHGMLFVFATPHILSFWMKNTLIPLSIGFFDRNKILLNTEDMFPVKGKTKDIPVYTSRSTARYALEVPINWFKDHQVIPGMKFSFQDPSSSAKMVNHE